MHDNHASFSIIFVKVADEYKTLRLFCNKFLMITTYRMSDSDNTQLPIDTPQEE